MNLILLLSLFLSLPQGEGFFYLYSPYTTPRRYLGIDFSVSGSSAPCNFMIQYNPLQRRHTYLSSDLLLSYGVSDYFNLFVSPKMYAKFSAPSNAQEEDITYSEFRVSYIETGIGMHLPFQIGRSQLGVGVRPSATFSTDDIVIPEYEQDIIDSGFKPFVHHEIDYTLNFLGEYRVERFSALLKVGYTIRGKPREPNERRESGFDFGVGMKFAVLSPITLGTAIIGRQNAEEIFLSPQISLKVPFGMFQIESHIPISNFDFIPDREIHLTPAFGIRYKRNLKTFQDPPRFIKIAGEVIDSISGEPLQADVELVGPVHRWSKSDEITGGFAFALPRSGTYRITVTKEGYHSLTKVARLMPKDSLFSRFVLERVVDVSIAGRIVDAGTREPIPVDIALMGEKVYRTVSDSITGRYEFWAETGAYNLVIEKSGYKKKVIPVYITNRATILMDVEMEIPKRDRFLWW